MKRISIIFIVSVLFVAYDLSYAVEMMETEYYASGKVFDCPLGRAVTIELPMKGRYKILNGRSEYWSVERLYHLIWVLPKVAGKDLDLKIRNGKKGVIVVRLRSVGEGEKESYRILVEEFPGAEGVEEREARKIRTEFELSVDGGFVGGGKGKGRFNLNGESILAVKMGGVIGQVAGKVEVNNLIKQYGFSAGLGYELGRLGVFLFVDGLLYRYDDWQQTAHIQVRPAVRVKFEHVAGSLFVARGITKDRYVGRDVVDNGLNLGIYHRAVDHLGLDLGVNLAGKFYVDLRSIIGKGVWKLEASSGYRVLKNLYVNVGYDYTHCGDLNVAGFENNSRFYAGLTVGIGSHSRFRDLRKRIIYRPDYPLVAAVKKEKTDESREGLTVNLTGRPGSGYAPLPVDFNAAVAGGNPVYEVRWYIDGKVDQGLMGERVQKVFNEKGTYHVQVRVTDKDGLTGISNVVVIEVLEETGDESFTIVSTADEGGSIDPLGSIRVKKGEKRKYFMKPGSGYKVGDVLVDKRSIGPKSSYEFKNVSADHTIHVKFVAAGVHTYTITAGAGPGGTISPEGSVTAVQGHDVHFSITPLLGYRIKEVKVDDESRGALSSYTFEKVCSDHTIRAEFERVTYTITASAGTGGRTDPAGTRTVNEGENLSVKIIPDDGYQVADVKVDQKSVGAVGEYNFTNVHGDHSLYAEFTTVVIPTHTITASAGEGGSISPAGSVAVQQGSDATFTVTPAAGYRIREVRVDGVSKGALGEYAFQNVTADHTIRAEFERITYTISLDSGTGGRTDPAGQTVVNQGDDLVVRIAADEGYEIADVQVDGKSVGTVSQYRFANIHSHHSLYAEFEKKIYTITATAGSGGGIDPPGTVIVEHGDSMKFTVTPSTGYLIDDVWVDGISKGAVSTYTFAKVTASHTIRAEFKIQTFTIEASSATGGRIRPTGTIIVEYGTDKTFSLESAQPQVYEIDRLMVDGRNKGALLTYTFTNITADHTIRALWKKRQYKIESSCTEGGTIAPLGTRWYEAQAAPTYTVTPEPGYVIERVVIDGSRSVGPVRAYTFDPLLADHTIRAYFKLKTYTVTVSRRYSDGSTGTPPNPVSPLGTVTVNHGDDLSIQIDNHYQGGGGSVIYSLDYITVNGASHTYRGDTKSIIIHTLLNIMEDKQVVCYFYQRTN